jgi:glycerol-3-phosphate dehydrogenase
LVGGKWTTQRAFGEQVTDQVLKLLGQPRKQSTEDLPIGGGRGYQAIAGGLPGWANKVAAKTGLPAERISELFDRYGSQAEDIAAAMEKLGKDSVLKGASGYSRNEVLVIVNTEQVNHIDDFLLRRSSLAIRGLVPKGLIEELSTIMAGALGWSKAEAKAEVKRAADLLTTKHRMSL